MTDLARLSSPIPHLTFPPSPRAGEVPRMGEGARRATCPLLRRFAARAPPPPLRGGGKLVPAPAPPRSSRRCGRCPRNCERVLGCAWSPDGGRIASASWDRSLRICDARSGKCLRVPSGHSDSVSGCTWSADGGHIVSASYDNSLRVRDAKAMKEADFSVTFLSDGNFVSLAEDRKTII